MTFRIAVLASGGGTDLQSILDACNSGQIKGSVAIVISNNPDAYALERGKKHGAETLVMSHKGKSREEHEVEVGDAIESRDIDLIVLAGYLRMFTSYFVERFKWKIINVHPALLPNFGGAGYHGMKVHEAVLASGLKESGCSVHFVTEEIDGGPVIGQMRVPVLDGDTPETLQARVLEKEHILLPLVVQWFSEGRISLEEGKVVVHGETN